MQPLRFGKLMIDNSVQQNLNWWQKRRLNQVVESARPQVYALEQDNIHFKLQATKSFPQGGMTTGISGHDCENNSYGIFLNTKRPPYLLIDIVGSNGKPLQYLGTDNSLMTQSRYGAGKD